MAKKERNFHGEADFLRHQLRELSVEMGVKIKDTNFMKKEECKEEIEALNRVKYRKEVEIEVRVTIDNLGKELEDRKNQIIELEKELADRSNQITIFEKKELTLKKEKQNCIDIILEKDKKIEELKIEIKELQEIKQDNSKIIKNTVERLAVSEKDLQEKKEK